MAADHRAQFSVVRPLQRPEDVAASCSTDQLELQLEELEASAVKEKKTGFQKSRRLRIIGPRRNAIYVGNRK
jgi:hypothetical protein